MTSKERRHHHRQLSLMILKVLHYYTADGPGALNSRDVSITLAAREVKRFLIFDS